ncbi:acyl-CoA dehydrogenase protein [Teladorsagia circumcincta]|uniref:Acyl-CoA dehydrogenase protein n=1 Tax=Teladorsagia circumcincta TaxID=45464 RepID=A0A2G9V2B3_TELCI|nr:acyl-CoA dehydrogenase protein [Teladorsagia circumcincta]
MTVLRVPMSLARVKKFPREKVASACTVGLERCPSIGHPFSAIEYRGKNRSLSFAHAAATDESRKNRLRIEMVAEDSTVRAELRRLMVRDAARHLDADSIHKASMCAMAKLHVTENCSEVVNQALQMFGGYGYLKDYPIQQYLRDLRLLWKLCSFKYPSDMISIRALEGELHRKTVHHILEGSNEIMRLIVGRDLLNNQTYGPM